MTLGRESVEMEVTALDGGLTKIVLSGRLDAPGVDRVEAPLVAVVVPGSHSAIVDISRVDFVASMGIRMLIMVARSLALRKAKLALYGARPMVNEVFGHVKLRDFVTVVDTEAEAIAAVAS
jgi:anti-anti-sigma factor